MPVTIRDLEESLTSRVVTERARYDQITSKLFERPLTIKELVLLEDARAAYPSRLPEKLRADYVCLILGTDQHITRWRVCPCTAARSAEPDSIILCLQGSQCTGTFRVRAQHIRENVSGFRSCSKRNSPRLAECASVHQPGAVPKCELPGRTPTLCLAKLVQRA